MLFVSVPHIPYVPYVPYISHALPKLSSYHRRSSHIVMMTKQTNCDIVKKELRALNVGLSLDIMTKIATDIRYGHNIVDPDLLILELLLGYHTYGMDRYKDDGTNDSRMYIYDIVFIIIISILSSKNNMLTAMPFEILIYLTRYYKDAKQHLAVMKPIYVALMWCIAIIILPSVLHDNNFSILKEPLDYAPYFFLMMATSNNKDLDDVEDDKNNNIQTIPVKYGIEISQKISSVCMALFVGLLSINILDHYDFFMIF